MPTKIKLPDGRLISVPDDAKPEEIDAIANESAGPSDSGPQGSALGRFAGGVGEMLNPLTAAQGLYQTVRHPYENVVKPTMEHLEKATTARRGGQYNEWANQMTAAVPIVGPLLEGISQQAKSGDIAGAMGKGVGLVAAPKVYGKVLGKAGEAAKAGAEFMTNPEGLASSLERGAASRVTDVITPKSTSQKAIRLGNKGEKLAPEIVKMLVEDKAPWSRQELHRMVGTKLEDAGLALDDVADNRLKARSFDTAPIIEDLKKQRAEYVAPAIEASSAIPSLKTIQTPRVPLREPVSFGPNGPVEVPSSVSGNPNPRFQTSPAEAVTVQETSGRASFAPGAEGASGAQAAGFGVGGRPGYSVGSRTAPVTTRPSTGPRSFQSTESGSAVGEVSGTPNPAFATEAPSVGSGTRLVQEGRPFGRDQPLPNKRAQLAVIDRAIKQIKGLGPRASYEALRRIRADADVAASVKYNPATVPDFLTKAGEASGFADVAGTLRDHLAKFDPETAAANAPFSLWKNLKQVMDATAELERSRPKRGAAIIARLTGGMIGGKAGGLHGAIAGFALGPTVDSALSSGVTKQLKIARTMARLAGAIRRADVGHVNALTTELKNLSNRVEPPKSGPLPESPATQPPWLEDVREMLTRLDKERN